MSKRKTVSNYYEKFLRPTTAELKTSPAVNSENAIFEMIRRKLVELSMGRFKWFGLPEEVDERFLEQTLLENGFTLFYLQEKFNKYVAVPASFGALDYQKNPTTFNVTTNMFSDQKTYLDSVPIWANFSRSSEMDIINIYASRLARLDRTIDINLNSARQTKILVATPETQLSVENFNRQLEEGQYVVRVRSDLLESVSTLDLSVDANLFEKVSLARTRIWNECMGLLGIKHANQDKKERLVSDEVAANDEQISFMKDANIFSRKEAAKQINKMFNLNVDVEYDSGQDVQAESFIKQLNSLMADDSVDDKVDDNEGE